MPGVKLFFMQSSGGLTDAHGFRGKDAILSGPAGGVVGMVRTAQIAGFDRVIGFDMGGTSTDVSHFAGEFERAFETAGRRRARARADDEHSHGRRGRRLDPHLRRRPASAPGRRARDRIPGPACYRRGGPLAVTDANVMVGKIQPASFPEPVRARAPTSRSTPRSCAPSSPSWPAEIERANGRRLSPEQVAEGFIDIAVGAMANAVKKISVARGYDVTRYTLQCYGGAGGQHACRVADALGIDTVFVHPLAGVLSAYGMGLADQSVMRRGGRRAAARRTRSRSSPSGSSRSRGDAERELERQTAATRGEPVRAAPAGASSLRRHRLRARRSVRHRGRRSSRRVRGRLPAALRVPDARSPARGRSGVGGGDRRGPCPGRDRHATARSHRAARRRRTPTVPMFSGGRWWDAGLVVARAHGSAVRSIDGPAIIAEANATTVVEPGWRAQVTDLDHLVLERAQPRADAPGDRNRRRSGDARGVQQPVHEHRRADGRAAAEHRLLGQHQGAARLLVRRSSTPPATWSPTRRTCRCTSAR